MHGGLYDDVLLSVQAPANLVPLTGRDALLFTQAAGELAVLEAGWSAVVAGSENDVILRNYRPILPSKTSGASSNLCGYI